MQKIKIKVCGMRSQENISQLTKLTPDFIGFIFYEKSSRFVGEDFEEDKLLSINTKVNRTGVFVNSTEEYILTKISKYSLSHIQLHGNETPSFCKKMREKATVIKAFGIDTSFNFDILDRYINTCDYFLFDTKTELKGGSGKKFRWELLNQYKLNLPFFLSGGLSLDDVDDIKDINHSKLFAIDINSRFEVSPALKDINKVGIFITKIRNADS